ncbi:leishmanolysin-like peptidase [Paramacrobiotus metropolitanus]|uniref:leishmanolysin-like peptidase n=1 Tax=Paramacrobiotus metropolitanus TaxID=2943436 RepID=UPI002445FFB0|nr:leishmanolysin-like peptidase [Paramacrobiotus metropolitanus]
MQHLLVQCALTLSGLTSLLLPLSSASCSYKPPKRDQVLPPVSLESSHNVSKRSTPEWGQLRVSLHYDDKSLNALSNRQQRLIKEVILPQAVKFWSEALKVVRSTTPIRLHRKCLTNSAGEYRVHYPDPSNTNVFYCDQGCDPKTFCGDVPVPDKHLLQCLYLASSPSTIFSDLFPVSVTTKQAVGPPDGPGVASADFVLYVSTLETERCNVSKTVAYAAHCQQEMTYDRPIAGHANLCPHAISDNPSDIETILSTVKHEILHALGFSVALFAFYRDENGSPRTPRDKYGRPQWNSELNTYQWSDSTIRHIERPNWQVRGGEITRPMDLLVTPRVTEEARRHFGCNDLEGAELENQGGEGTLLTHWEKRVFENEAMTGVHTQNPVYSNITFAALEDSGWYQPNYSLAREVTFGAGQGCGFAMKSCKSWMDQALQKKTSVAPYCNRLKTSSNNMVKTECSTQRNALSICNLAGYSTDLPPEYQNFDSISGVPDDMVGHYGGSVDLADYCPFMQEFSWKSTAGTVRGARCTVEENQPEPSMNFALEKYGKDSVCFAQDKPWSERTCVLTRTWQHWGSGCYEHACQNGRLHVIVANRTIICYSEGQRLQLQILGNEWLHTGTVICPACGLLCPDRDNFTCLPDMPLKRDQKERESWDYLECNAAANMVSLPDRTASPMVGDAIQPRRSAPVNTVPFLSVLNWL